MSDLQPLWSPGLQATLDEAARKHGDVKRVPVGANGQMRHCARCERLRAEFERHDRNWTPNLCHSWVSNGRRYWAATCKPCGDIEQAERDAARGDTTQPVATGPKPTLGMGRSSPAFKRHTEARERTYFDEGER